MTDVFVSYASADRDRAKAVADALAAQGWSVWWDRTIPPGKQFDQVIEEALDAASCVVVLWSRASVASNWVKTEAAEAMRRNVLVPALIEDARIPLEFRRVQAADLSQWRGEGSHPEFEKCCQSIREHLQPGHPRPKPAPEPPPRRPVEPRPSPEPLKPRRSKRSSILAAVAGVVLIGASAIGFTVYSDHVARADLEARIRLEEARSQAEARRKAEQAAAEEAAKRKADESRRASQQATSPAKSERDRNQYAFEQRTSSSYATAPGRDGTQRIVEQRSSTSYSSALEWRDHVLRYTGTVKWSTTDANMKVAVFDLGTRLRVGDYDVPARVSKVGPSEYIVSADFQVPRDSVSPYPHVHAARLTIRVEDGLPRLVQNCPRAGECYPGDGSGDLPAMQRELDRYNETARRLIDSMGR
jgi:hypothetical protein